MQSWKSVLAVGSPKLTDGDGSRHVHRASAWPSFVRIATRLVSAGLHVAVVAQAQSVPDPQRSPVTPYGPKEPSRPHETNMVPVHETASELAVAVMTSSHCV